MEVRYIFFQESKSMTTRLRDSDIGPLPFLPSEIDQWPEMMSLTIHLLLISTLY